MDWLKKFFMDKIFDIKSFILKELFNLEFVKQIIKKGIGELSKLIDNELERIVIAQKINKWLNIPFIDEEQEEKVITTFLKSAYDLLVYLEKKLT